MEFRFLLYTQICFSLDVLADLCFALNLFHILEFAKINDIECKHLRDGHFYGWNYFALDM